MNEERTHSGEQMESERQQLILELEEIQGMIDQLTGQKSDTTQLPREVRAARIQGRIKVVIDQMRQKGPLDQKGPARRLRDEVMGAVTIQPRFC